MKEIEPLIELESEGKMTIEDYEKRFGAIAVEIGFISLDQLLEAMRIQITENTKGKSHRLIGQILFDLGFMTFDQIDEVLRIVVRKTN